MSGERTSRRCPCISGCSMGSPKRPSSSTIPMCVWSNNWTTGNKGHAARRRGHPIVASTFRLTHTIAIQLLAWRPSNRAGHVASGNICLCLGNGHGLLLFHEGGKDKSDPTQSTHTPVQGMEFEMVEKAEMR